MTLHVSNPERVLYPDAGITKAELVAHMERFATRILPHVIDRPLTLERYPKGINEAGFMQKNIPSGHPATIERCAVPKRGGQTNHPMVRDREGLRYLANLSTISLHAPTARCHRLRQPDRIVFDLDPPEHDDTVAAATYRLGSFLADLGLPTVPMATGSKGYHLVAFIAGGPQASAIARAAQGCAELMVAAAPDVFTTAFRKTERRGRIFLDWLRNAVPATSIVPYTLRPRATAPMATPLTWKELDAVGPADVTLPIATTRLAAPDPWTPIMAAPVDARPFMENVDRALTDAGVELRPFDRFRA